MLTPDYNPLVGNRPETLRPHHPRCPRHLRRICGTCAHFGGALNDRDPKPCAIWERLRAADDPARDCRHWERRGPGPT